MKNEREREKRNEKQMKRITFYFNSFHTNRERERKKKREPHKSIVLQKHTILPLLFPFIQFKLFLSYFLSFLSLFLFSFLFPFLIVREKRRMKVRERKVSSDNK